MASEKLRKRQIEQLMTDVIEPGLTYDDVHRRYAESIFGLHHADQPLRYAQRYGYSRDQMLKDLGDDVHPVKHGPYTHRKIAVPFLSAEIWNVQEHLGQDDILAIRMAAINHDIGETTDPAISRLLGSLPGDVNYNDKKPSDSKKERQVRHYLYGELFPDVPLELLEASEAVIDNHDTVLGLAFDTIERVGYYQTALRAGALALELASSSDSKLERFTNLARLAIDVTENHHDMLRERSKIFPYARTVLKKGRPIYDQTHIQLPTLLQQFDQTA